MDTDVFETWQVVVAVAAYGIGMTMISFYSPFPARDWLLQRIAHLKVRPGFQTEALRELLDDTKRSLGWWLLRASQVQAGWRQVHAVEDDYAMRQDPGEVGMALVTIRDNLDVLDVEGAQSLAERIDAALEEIAEPGDVTTGHRALLRDAQVFRHNVRDSSYEELAEIMSKGIWLALVGLAAIAVLSEVLGRELYFLFGAIGGLLSRLKRLLNDKPAAADYGASWSTLILSPVTGALAAWIGVGLVAALGTDPISFIDGRIPPLIWDQGNHVFGLALAFLFGWSERFFSAVADVSEERFSPLVTKRGKKDGGRGDGKRDTEDGTKSGRGSRTRKRTTRRRQSGKQ